MDKYLKNEEIKPEELKAALRRAVIAYKLVPIFAGSSLRNKGVQPLLDGVIDYLPSPVDLGQVKGTNSQTGTEEIRKLVPEESLSGLAFKPVAT